MRRATLLVADRNPRFLDKTAEILAEAGHLMISVTDGQAARLQLTKELDGVLVHAALPGLSGFALCRLAKEKEPNLPVVIMFSAEDERGEDEARRAGADNWLVRPIKRLELLYVARDLIQMRLANGRTARAVEEREQAVRDAQSVGTPDSSRLVQFELFKRLLGIELKRSQRYGFPLSILLASLDGDEANGSGRRDLLAQAARSAIRDIDIPVAFAESDVLVVMPHTDLEGAKLVAERIRKKVRARASEPGGPTASIGVVAAQGGERLTFATLLAQATRAQKQAIKGGGDQVIAG